MTSTNDVLHCLTHPVKQSKTSLVEVLVLLHVHLGLGSWPNINQAPALGLTIFKSMAPTPAPVKFSRFY